MARGRWPAKWRSLRRTQIGSGTTTRAQCWRSAGTIGRLAKATAPIATSSKGNSQSQVAGPTTIGRASTNAPQALRESVR